MNKSCGSPPEVAEATIRASGLRPMRAAADSEATTTAAAPSLIMDELPAVMVVSGPNAGFKRASCARSVSARGPSSREMESPTHVGWEREQFPR